MIEKKLYTGSRMGFSNICVAQCQRFKFGVAQLNQRGRLSLEVRCPVVKAMGSAGEDGSSPAAWLSSLTAKLGDG